MAQVTRKYSKLKRPVYAKRQEAIAHVPEFWFRVVRFTYLSMGGGGER